MKAKYLILLLFLLLLTSCTLSTTHTHNFSSKYAYDDEYHYYECLSATCNEVKAKTKHEYEISDNVMTCIICGFTKDYEHVHSFDEIKHNVDAHYYLCSCGESSKEEPHKFSDWTVKTEPTETTTGIKSRNCSVCSLEEEEVIPVIEHTHSFSENLNYNETSHYKECSCGEKKDISSHNIIKTIQNKTNTSYEIKDKCSICNYQNIVSYELQEVLNIVGYNTLSQTSNGLDNQGIRLYKQGVVLPSSLYWHKVLVKKINSNYQVSNVIPSGSALINDYDYLLLVYNPYSVEYQSLTNLSVGDYLRFSSDITTLANNDILINVTKTDEVIPFNVTYNFGYDTYSSKDELYNEFFTEFYNYIISQDNNYLNGYGISTLEQFLAFCKDFNALGKSEMKGIGEVLGKYFVNIVPNGSLSDQTTSFVGYCYQNNKYIDLLEFFRVFFAYWRTDEGFTTPTNHGNDFFYSSWASIIDVCKYFYFSSSALTNTYPWFTIEKSPRVHEALENTPGVVNYNLQTSFTTTSNLENISRLNYRFMGWYDEFDNLVTSVSSDIEVYAKWERNKYDVTFISDNKIDTIEVLEGNLVNIPKYTNNLDIKAFLTDSLNTHDIYEPVNSNKTLFVLFDDLVNELGTANIVAFNSQNQTSSVEKYHGLRLYKEGVNLDSQLYWLKIGIINVNGEYYVNQITPSGTQVVNNYDYLLLVYSSDNTNTYNTLINLNIALNDKVTFNTDINTLSKGECNVVVTFSRCQDVANIIMIHNDVTMSNSIKTITNTYTLPILSKAGKEFMGWYTNPTFTGNAVTTVTTESDLILYAKWVNIEINSPLDYVSDVLNVNTIDSLPQEFNGMSVSYSTNRPEIYVIDNNTGTVSMRYLTHTKQTITVYATYNGNTVSKEVTVNPIVFKEMVHPKATYFQISSTSSYILNSERYQQEGTLFSNKFKENMDMVYYAFAIPQEDGTLSLDTRYLDEVLDLREYGIRVLLVIDGANRAPLQAMVKLCNNQNTRQIFVNNIINLVTQYGFDGVDVDWEFPGILASTPGYEQYTTSVDIVSLNNLLRDLRNALDAIQDPLGSKYLLTIATPPTYWGQDRFDYATINQYCDYVNMMSYDLNKSGTASHLSHVHIPSNNYSYQFSCEYGIDYYVSRGLSSSKIILGSAAYGKAYKVSGTTPNTDLPGLGMSGQLGQVTGYGLPGQNITWNSGTIFYTGIDVLLNNENFTLYHEYNSDGEFVGSYLYSSVDNYFITFDSVKAIEEKCSLASSYTGMGIMVWAYGEDATDTIVNTIIDNL